MSGQVPNPEIKPLTTLIKQQNQWEEKFIYSLGNHNV